jgi:hypothetical protein
MNLTAVYVRDGAWIAAWIEEIPGVNTQGATLEEARANLRDALALMPARSAATWRYPSRRSRAKREPEAAS